jgi:hypothetical protein
LVVARLHLKESILVHLSSLTARNDAANNTLFVLQCTACVRGGTPSRKIPTLPLRSQMMSKSSWMGFPASSTSIAGVRVKPNSSQVCFQACSTGRAHAWCYRCIAERRNNPHWLAHVTAHLIMVRHAVQQGACVRAAPAATRDSDCRFAWACHERPFARHLIEHHRSQRRGPARRAATARRTLAQSFACCPAAQWSSAAL